MDQSGVWCQTHVVLSTLLEILGVLGVWVWVFFVHRVNLSTLLEILGLVCLVVVGF